MVYFHGQELELTSQSPAEFDTLGMNRFQRQTSFLKTFLSLIPSSSNTDTLRFWVRLVAIQLIV